MPNCSGEGGIKTGTRFRAFAIPKISVAFLKPGAILIPLEVYMVNSPSRPNLCPADPPPFGASVRHPLSLPRSHAGWGRSSPRSQVLGGWPSAKVAVHQGGRPQEPSRLNQGRNTSNQGSSSLIKANGKISMTAPIRQPATGIALWNSPFATPRLCVKNQASSHNQPSIKAKTPVIVHNQGISRQTLKNSNTTIPSANGAAPYQPRRGG